MKRLLPLGILLLVAFVVFGFVARSLWNIRRTVTELPLRHKEATTSIRLVYAYFQKRGKWPSGDEFQDLGLERGLTKEWSYWCTPSDNSTLLPPKQDSAGLILHGPFHTAVAYHFEPPRSGRPSVAWSVGSEGGSREFAVSEDYTPSGSPISDQELIASMIHALENAILFDRQCADDICRLPQCAPTSAEAQEATIRYIAYNAASDIHGVPVFCARSLSLYDTAFAARIMTLLSASQNEGVIELCLITLALMGEKARTQIPALETYLHAHPDSRSRLLAQIVLAILRRSLDESTSQAIERSIHEREPAGLHTVSIAMRIGFRGWATDGIISQVKQRLCADATYDRNDDFSCAAAIALAVSDQCDTQCEEIVKTLLAAATDDPDSPVQQMYYAYALALANRTCAEAMWRVVLKTYVRYRDFPVDSAASIILETAPREHVEILERLHKDPDPGVASSAADFRQCLELISPP